MLFKITADVILRILMYLDRVEMDIDIEQVLKILVVFVLFAYAVGASTVFEVHYPKQLVNLYTHPWWRLLLVTFIVIGWRWSPLIGVLIGVVVFFYLHDMYLLMSPTE